jgi:hypothetical protein
VSLINEDDLDRLADYTAGLLDARAGAEVAELIEAVPAWARAYSDLTMSGAQISAGLRDLETPELPTDIAERIDALLAGLASESSARSSARSGSAGTGDREGGAAGTRGAAVARTKEKFTTRRRRARLLTGSAVAVVALALCFGAVFAFDNQLSSTRSGKATSGAARQPQFGKPSFVELFSGRNYTAQTLGGRASADSGGTVSGSGTGAAGVEPLATMPDELRRLRSPGALNACLSAVVQTEGVLATSVDFARFNGSPALIVDLTNGRIVVVGPNCGLSGVGAAEIYSVER